MQKHYWKKTYLTHQQVAQKIYDYVDTVPMEDLLALMERKTEWKYLYDKWEKEPSWVKYVFLPLLLLFPLFWVSLPFFYVLNGYWGFKNIRIRNLMGAVGWPYDRFCYDDYTKVSRFSFSFSALGWENRGMTSEYSRDLDDILRGIDIIEERNVDTSLRFRLTIFPFFFILVILLLLFPLNYILTGRRTWDLDWIGEAVVRHRL